MKAWRTVWRRNSVQAWPLHSPASVRKRGAWHYADETTSPPTKQPKNGCQVVGYNSARSLSSWVKGGRHCVPRHSHALVLSLRGLSSKAGKPVSFPVSTNVINPGRYFAV